MRVDLLVIGAGIQGATAAHAASLRGLSVCLLDRGDLGGGASSNSMKIAHGGLRYLQTLDLRRSLVSVREQRRLRRLAPDLVRPLRVRLDLAGHGPASRALLRAGLPVYDLLSAHRNRGVAAEARLPRSAYPRWHDALIEDTERLLLGFVHSAVAAQPGRVHVRLYTHVRHWPRPEPREVELDDGQRLRFGAVLDCTGAFRRDTRPVLSMNLVTDALRVSAAGEAVGFRHREDGRHLFVVPWRGRSIVGTFNRDYPFAPEDPLRLDPAWVDEAVAWVRSAAPQLGAVSRDAVRLVHAGLLPRAPGAGADPAERDALTARDGALEVRGVKWTTAYGLSERAVALAARRARLVPGPAHPPVWVDPEAERGAYLEKHPDLAAPLLPGRCALPRGALHFAVEREWACRLDDVLLRRTGLASAGHPGRAVAEAAARVLQPLLDRSEPALRAELEAFHDDPRFAGNVPE